MCTIKASAGLVQYRKHLEVNVHSLQALLSVAVLCALCNPTLKIPTAWNHWDYSIFNFCETEVNGGNKILTVIGTDFRTGGTDQVIKRF